ncbi:MAG: hypothetical protein IPM16_22475 [Chloroflexi bacterium]|nr:hypothetical protein [Chloroflexota bacterium]
MSVPHPPQANHHVVRVRRRSLAEWMGLAIWVVLLAILFEYTVASIGELESQAAVVVGALFLGLLSGGIVVQVMRGADARNRYRDENYRPSAATTTDRDVKEQDDDSRQQL